MIIKPEPGTAAPDPPNPTSGPARIADQIPLDDLSSSRLRKLHEYWTARRPGGRLAGRQHIDPLELGFIIGHLALVDVLRDPLRFRYRLIGTHLVAQVGFDLTGRMLDEHPEPTFRRLAAQHYSHVATTAQALALRSDAVMDGRIRRYEVLLLPLARDGATVDMILAGMWFL